MIANSQQNINPFSVLLNVRETHAAKNLLQERVVKLGFPNPVYTTERVGGVEHAPVFTSTVRFAHMSVVGPKRYSKIEAEVGAASCALEHVGDHERSCPTCEHLARENDRLRAQIKAYSEYANRMAELHNSLMHSLNGNEQPGRWYEIVNGKSVLCQESVEESMNRLANLCAAAPRSDKRLVVYAVTAAALGEGVRALDSQFEDEFDSELADLHRDVKYRERVVRAASKKVQAQKRAAKEARDREGADATFEPDEDAAGMRRHIRAVTQIINDFEAKPVRRLASMLRHQLLDGKILEAIRVKLGSSSSVNPSTLDDVVRRWFAGGYMTSSTMMKHITNVEATVKAEFPDGYSGMTQIPADPSRLLSAWAESHNSRMHALFGNIVTPWDVVDQAEFLEREKPKRYIETLFEQFEMRVSAFIREGRIPGVAARHALNQKLNAITCEIVSQGADSYLERLAAARNKLMHALNGNTDSRPESVALIESPVAAPTEVRTADIAAMSDQIVQSKPASEAQVNAAALQLQETGGSGLTKLTRGMAYMIAKAMKRHYDVPTTPSRQTVNGLWGTYQKVRNWESAFTQYGMPLEKPEFGAMAALVGTDGFRVINPSIYTTVEPSQGIIAERLILSQAGTALNEAASAVDFSNLSNPLRTNNAVYNMQAFLALMSYTHATVTGTHTGLPASAAPFYLRVFQHLMARLPLSTPCAPSWDVGFVPDVNFTFNARAASFPLKTAAIPAAPAINAILVNMDSFVQWLKGGTGANVNFQPTELDRNCIVIPVTDDMVTNVEALRAWVICHLESPMREIFYSGSIGGNPTSVLSYATATRIPGVSDNVMLVYMPGNATNNLSLNFGAQQVQIGAVVAAGVDIGPDLYATAGNANLSPFMQAYQFALRAYGTGNGHDLAMIAAADNFWRFRRSAVVTGSVLKEGEYLSAANTTAELEAAYLDYTTANLCPSSTIGVTRNLSSVGVRIPALSSIAAVLMAGNFAKPATTTVFGIQTNAATLALRLNDVARMMAHRADLIAQGLELTTEVVYHCGDVPADLAIQYRTLVGYEGGDRGSSTLYTALNSGFKGYQITMIPLLNHTNPVSFALFPSAQWTPVSRFGAWVEAEVETLTPKDDTGLPARGAIYGPKLLNSQEDVIGLSTAANQQIRYVKPLPKSSTTGLYRRQLLCCMNNAAVFYIPNERAVASFQIATPYTPLGWDTTFRASIFAYITLPTQAPPTDIPHGATPLTRLPSDLGTLSIGLLNLPELWMNVADRSLAPFGLLELGRLGEFSTRVNPNSGSLVIESGEF